MMNVDASFDIDTRDGATRTVNRDCHVNFICATFHSLDHVGDAGINFTWSDFGKPIEMQ
jgi:hypothetical protein